MIDEIATSYSVKINFTAGLRNKAIEKKKQLIQIYGQCPIEECNVIVAVGGDGLMLHTIHKMLHAPKPIYGINEGSVGFLMNDSHTHNLIERLQKAKYSYISPLTFKAVNTSGQILTGHAINEVSLIRSTYQAANLDIEVDGKIRMNKLISDGILVATPAGTTAYNRSVNGPILPLTSRLLAITPISPFRPRQWRGALLPSHSKIKFNVCNPDSRTVQMSADIHDFKNVTNVTIKTDKKIKIKMLFDDTHTLEERIFAEQFQ